MNAPRNPLTIHRIFHPTDFSQDSQVAFAHALKLALLYRAELTIMHVDPDVSPEGFEDFPRIRPTLAKWGLLPESSSKSDVTKLGLRIRKVRALAADAKQAIIHHLTGAPTDLMVLATHQKDGFARWGHHPVAQPVSREMHVKTLFVPSNVEGFVSRHTGETSLHRLLLPISTLPSSQPAIDVQMKFLQLFLDVGNQFQAFFKSTGNKVLVDLGAVYVYERMYTEIVVLRSNRRFSKIFQRFQCHVELLVIAEVEMRI